MEKDRIKQLREEIDKKTKERDERMFAERVKKNKERYERKMEQDSAIPINLISQTEMKAHTKEIRSEMDSKFVDCLMATGVTRAEAIKQVRVWNAKKGYGYHGR